MSAGSLHLIQATNAASSGFRKGRCTLELKAVQSKMQFCMRIRFHAAFPSQQNPEAKRWQGTEAKGEGRAINEEELLPCCWNAAVSL